MSGENARIAGGAMVPPPQPGPAGESGASRTSSPPAPAPVDPALARLVRAPALPGVTEDTLAPMMEVARRNARPAGGLDGYLLVRRLDHRPVAPEDIARLVPADLATQDARQALPFGRGNVEADARQPLLESGARALAAKQLSQDAWQAGHQLMVSDAQNWEAVTAMTAQVFGAGNCGQYAAVAAFAYGERAQQLGRPGDESIRLAHEQGKDHFWIEVHDADRSRQPLVVDPWADGPAVLAEDSRFAQNRAAITSEVSFDPSVAADAAGVVRETAERALVETKARVDLRLDAQRPHAFPPDSPDTWPGRFRTGQPVLGDALLARSRDALDSGDPARRVRAGIEAVGIAMARGSTGVSRLVEEATAIVDEAKALVAPVLPP